MMAKNENRVNITLKCPNCGEARIRTEKNKRNDPERMEINKFCSRCRCHTAHKETKN
ncbi:MAG: 50S ribosomal protein L33 [Bacilli bacterium]